MWSQEHTRRMGKLAKPLLKQIQATMLAEARRDQTLAHNRQLNAAGENLLGSLEGKVDPILLSVLKRRLNLYNAWWYIIVT